MKAEWTNTDRILYGIMAGGVVIWAVAMFIEACRARPKVQVLAFGIKKPVKQPVKPGPDESSSAAE